MPNSARKPIVIVTRKLPDVVETRMRELFDARLNIDDTPMTRSEIAEALKIADVLVVDGDPLENIHALTEVRMVIHNGVVIRGR